MSVVVERQAGWLTVMFSGLHHPMPIPLVIMNEVFLHTTFDRPRHLVLMHAECLQMLEVSARIHES